MKKIILSLFLGLFSVISLSAQSGPAGGSLSFSLLDNVLTISGIGEMSNFSGSNTPWYPYRDQIKKIVVSEGVTSIGNYAFYGLKHLEDVKLPNTVLKMGTYVFNAAVLKKKITIPASVTSLGQYIFYQCDSLPAIEVHKDNKNYSSADGVLYNKKQTQLMDYPSGKKDESFEIPSGVAEIIAYAGYNNKYLRNLIIPASVTSIKQYAFHQINATVTGHVGGNVIMKGSTPPIIESYAFYYYGNMQLTVPSGAHNSYMSKSTWQSFRPVVEAGSERVTPNASTLTFEARGQIQSISIASNIRWKATPSASWVKLSSTENTI